MLRLKADDWYEIKGRGKVAAIEQLPEEFYEQYFDPNQLIGREVEIDGQTYKVVGVETNCIGRSVDRPYQFSVGLLVKKYSL